MYEYGIYFHLFFDHFFQKFLFFFFSSYRLFASLVKFAPKQCILFFFFLNQKWNKIFPGGLVIKNLPASVRGVSLTLFQEVPMCHEVT